MAHEQNHKSNHLSDYAQALKDRAQSDGLAALETVIQGLALTGAAQFDYRKDAKLLRAMEGALDSIETLSQQLRVRKKAAILIELAEALDLFVYRPAFNTKAEPAPLLTEDDFTLPSTLQEVFTDLVHRAMLQLDGLHDLSPITMPPLDVDFAYWTNMDLLIENHGRLGPRSFSDMAVKALFSIGDDKTPTEQLTKGDTELENERRFLRGKQQSTGVAEHLGVTYQIERKAQLLNALYSKTMWFDPNQNFVNGLDTYAPHGDRRAKLIAAFAKYRKPDQQ